MHKLPAQLPAEMLIHAVQQHPAHAMLQECLHTDIQRQRTAHKPPVCYQRNHINRMLHGLMPRHSRSGLMLGHLHTSRVISFAQRPAGGWKRGMQATLSSHSWHVHCTMMPSPVPLRPPMTCACRPPQHSVSCGSRAAAERKQLSDGMPFLS